MRKNFLFISLFSAAFLERVVFDFGANIELVTTAMILSTFYLGKKKGLILTFLILLVTDLILGNTLIFLFTWSGFLIPIVFLRPKLFARNKILKHLSYGILAGFGSNLFFFLWTNFGVWLLDSWGMYSRDFSGLLHSYINALPFLKMQLISSLVFIPTGILGIEIFTRCLRVNFIQSRKFRVAMER